MRTNPLNVLRFKMLLMIVSGMMLLFGAVSAGAEEAPAKLWNEAAIARIAPIPATGTVTFAFFSDMHVPFDDGGSVGVITKKVNELKPAFVITGGDNVQVGNTANFKALSMALKRFQVPFIAGIGNHDTAFSDYADQREWMKRFGMPYFYFDVGPARIIEIDNANYEMGTAQLEFLEAALKTNLEKIIVMHRPTDYLNPKVYTTPLKESARFRELVTAAHVKAVFMGHEHHFGSYEVDGVRYIVSGGAGGKFDVKTDNNFHHFILATVSPGKFEFEVVKLFEDK